MLKRSMHESGNKDQDDDDELKLYFSSPGLRRSEIKVSSVAYDGLLDSALTNDY